MVLVLDEKQMKFVLDCIEHVGGHYGFYVEGDREMAEEITTRIHQLLDDEKKPGWKAADNPED
jgi:hypothetical protein